MLKVIVTTIILKTDLSRFLIKEKLNHISQKIHFFDALVHFRRECLEEPEPIEKDYGVFCTCLEF